MIKKQIKITNQLGLHARAAAKFVAHANHYGSEIEVRKKDLTVNGKSIMGVMTLAATKGAELELIITGDDEKEMMNDLETLIQQKFGEDS